MPPFVFETIITLVVVDLLIDIIQVIITVSRYNDVIDFVNSKFMKVENRYTDEDQSELMSISDSVSQLQNSWTKLEIEGGRFRNDRRSSDGTRDTVDRSYDKVV